MDDKPADVGLWVTIMVLVGAILMLFAVLLGTAKAEELSEISVTSAAYCSLFARQMVFQDMMHGPSLTADSDFVLARAKEHYASCLAVLPALMPLPDDTGSLQTWLADIRDLLVLRGAAPPHKALMGGGVANIGTEPASASPSEEEWRRQCRAEYRTWDEETGTVVRVGNPERQRCPCMGEVVCE